MSALLVLPMVWATEELWPEEWMLDPMEEEVSEPVAPGLAFYRKYTEALLRRYQKMSMEAGRAPSLLGREMFRGRVTPYQVHSFEDVVIFVHDVERCLEKLTREQRYFIERIALQEYTHDEAVEMMHLPRRTMVRQYEEALDRLTYILLDKKFLEPQKCCQGVNSVENSVIDCFN